MSARSVGLLLLAPPLLMGFSSASSFDLAAELGGGGGYAFTGSPSSHGLSCAMCHQASGPSQATLSVHSLPAGLLENGYAPGQVYLIDVKLVGEARGLERNGGCPQGLAGCNRNGMAAEIVDDRGAPVGLLCPIGVGVDDNACPTDADFGTALIAGAHALVGQSQSAPELCGQPNAHPDTCLDVTALRAQGQSAEAIDALIRSQVHGSTSWRFAWRAPRGYRGSVRLWLAGVDGDGGVSFDPVYATYEGDTVMVRVLELRSQEAAPAAPAADGCSARSQGPAPGALALVLLLLGLAGLVAVKRGPWSASGLGRLPCPPARSSRVASVDGGHAHGVAPIAGAIAPGPRGPSGALATESEPNPARSPNPGTP